MSDTMQVFDRNAKRLQRQRAVARGGDYDFLRAAVTERLLDRLDDIKRSFPLALVQGCDAGWLHQHLGGRGQVEQIVSMDAVNGAG
ncbi:MAG: SAM-dependent methyltransferase, partial [Ferrovibrio sp.]